MKNIVLFFLFISVIFAFDYSAKVCNSDDFFSVGFARHLYLDGLNSFSTDLLLGGANGYSIGIGFNYKYQDLLSSAYIFGVSDVLANYTKQSLYAGMVFRIDLSDLEVGIEAVGDKVAPYLQLSYSLGAFSPYVKQAQGIMVGLTYGFDLGVDSSEAELFSMVYPKGELETTRKNITVKGYYLDNGKVYFGGDEISLRSDGMFIKSLDIPKYGINDFIITLDGKYSGKKTHSIRIVRKYAFYDLDVVLQDKWGRLLSVADYPKTEEFLEDKVVTKADFFSNISDSELRKYLFSFHSKGLIQSQEKFIPENIISRREALTVISKIVTSNKKMIEYDFVDLSKRDLFYVHANKLANLGVIDASMVNPEVGLTRGNLLAYLYKLRESFDCIKEGNIIKQSEVVASPVITIEKKSVDFSSHSFDDIHSLSPK